jgi:hypothetical protein
MNSTGKSSFADAIQRYADEVVDEFAHDDLVTLATEIEEDIGVYDEGADTARSIAVELRRRAAAGVRKWPRLTD